MTFAKDHDTLIVMTTTLSEFVESQGITMDADVTDRNPQMDAEREMNHYLCTLRAEDRTMEVYFSTGIGWTREPTVEDVLDCLADDSAGVENARSFEDWCAEYGYDTDSRKAERTYNVCREQAEELVALVGRDAYRVLLFDTERL